ncbi:hypothetical protein VTK56DRAFT_5533 [Thermocarpiscus australiensis]
MANPDRFRVVIAGGGITGLTLANALEQAGVDYVVLERRSEVAPQLGASIGIFPHGARILDQLGAWKKVEEFSVMLKQFYTRDSKGNLICEPSQENALSSIRTGYFTSWGDRQKLLQVLYENLKDPSKILVNKSIVDIEHRADGVTAICEDGLSFRGDLLVGADGIYSKTRSKMWELAESDRPDLVKADKDCLIADYNCLFGIAKGVPHLAPADVDTAYNQDRCALTLAGEGGRTWYFVQERLPKTCRMGNIPRYTAEDTEAFVARNADIVIRPGPDGLTVGDLYKRSISYRLVAVEEAKFKLWHWGRIACAGDSIHKATPNLGVGGNSAIESVAVLANGIKRLADSYAGTGRRPTLQEIERFLADYQKTRELRAMRAVDLSGAVTRAQTLHGPASRFFVRFLLPRFSDFISDTMGEAIIGAEKLDFLPLPMASLTGMMPFNPTQGVGKKESKLKRMLCALPILALSLAALLIMDATPSLRWAKALRDSGRLELESGGSIPIVCDFYHVRGLDDLISLLNTYFFPSMYGYDPASRRQVISFLTDGTVLLTIWMFESVRRANLLTIMQWPNLFALLGQLLGLGVAGPLYCFLHYVLSPLENFSALDQRLTRLRWARAALPAVLLGYTLPCYLTLLWPAPAGAPPQQTTTRQLFLFVWQLYPLYVALALWAVSRLFRDTTPTDKLYRTRRDLPVMRWYVGAASALSAAVWLWAWAAGPGYGIRGVFVPGAVPRDVLPSLTEFTRQFLRWDELFGFGSHLLWLAYLFWDLRSAGMLREGWLRVVVMGIVSLLLVGPGATLGLGWLFREHILATRRHKNALTPESVGRLHGIPS